MFKFLVFFAFIYVCTATLPSYFKVCKRNDPELVKCIINSVNLLKPKLAEGIPELKVPPLEPLPLDEIKLRSGPSTAKIDSNITNLLVYGPSTFQVLELKPNLAKYRFVFRINVPHIYFKGDYDMDMNVLILKYRGQGPITGNFTDLGGHVVLKGHLENKNGKNHLQFEKFNIKLTIAKSYMHLGRLFEQDPHLGRATNDVINDNSGVFIDQIKPALESSLADKFTEVANNICNYFTFEELFPVD